MAKCNHCGKSTTFGHNRSFSLRATNRTFKPNLQKIRVEIDGKVKRLRVSVKAIKSGLVKRPTVRKAFTVAKG